MVFVAYWYESRLYLHTFLNAWFLRSIQRGFFQGCIIADSFLNGKSAEEGHRKCIGRILEQWCSPCRRYFLLCIPGASFVGMQFHAYAIMVCKMAPTTGIQHIVYIAMGNDLYRKAERKLEVLKAARCCFAAIAPYARQTLAFGGTAAVWKYEGQLADEYDDAVRYLILAFRSMPYLTAVDDCVSLKGLKLRDGIGHVDWSDEPSLRIITTFFLSILTHLPPQSKL